jgi:secondary thiamine-phosphate synthase enzyme
MEMNGTTLVARSVGEHITASVFINDDEGGLHHDYEVWLERLAPHAPIEQYWHNRTGADNADAHLKRQVMGREVVVAVTNGRLDFGTWERIFYGEFAATEGSGGSGCWSRLSGRCDPFARNYANRHRGWAARGKQSMASQP